MNILNSLFCILNIYNVQPSLKQVKGSKRHSNKTWALQYTPCMHSEHLINDMAYLQLQPFTGIHTILSANLLLMHMNSSLKVTNPIYVCMIYIFDVRAKSNILCPTLNHTPHQCGVLLQELIHTKEHWLRTPNRIKRNISHFYSDTKRLQKPLPYSGNLNLFEFCGKKGIVSLVPHS